MRDDIVFLENDETLGTVISDEMYFWYDGPIEFKAFNEKKIFLKNGF